jgi:hypothetical protein
MIGSSEIAFKNDSRFIFTKGVIFWQFWTLEVKKSQGILGVKYHV